MTEADWLTSQRTLEMLHWLTADGAPPGRHARVSNRKLRLFSCACCRAAWYLVPTAFDEPRRRGVEAAEACADGRLSLAEAAAAAREAEYGDASPLAWDCAWPDTASSAWNAVYRLLCVCDRSGPRVDTAALLRDLIGNPFRPARERASAVCHDRVPLAWLTPDVLAVARAAYDERLPAGAMDPARLAVLADALEEAGCTDSAILSHLRSPGPHYRGCWALDMVLGLS